ncbi:hypothetical protein JW835_10120 [bacterium]|nr:hypothetical protein [bacterium]
MKMQRKKNAVLSTAWMNFFKIECASGGIFVIKTNGYFKLREDLKWRRAGCFSGDMAGVPRGTIYFQPSSTLTGFRVEYLG